MMPDNDKPIQEDQGNTGGGNAGPEVDLSAFFQRGNPQNDKPNVRIVKKD